MTHQHTNYNPQTGEPFTRNEFGPFWLTAGIRPRRPRGDIRLGILALLEKSGALNGYMLMKNFAEETHGYWKPGAGSVYPTLAKLLEEEYITLNQNKEYELTPKARELIQEKIDTIKNVFTTPTPDEETPIQTSLQKLLNATHQFRQIATPEQETQLATKFDQLRKEIYKLLSE